MATAIQILNTIRDNASADYARIPLATKDNLDQVGKAITASSNTMNEFITSLVNKVAFSQIMSKMYTNPLQKLKSVGVPYGSTIEEIFINPATDLGFQTDGTYLLTNKTPDGKTAYYGQNRKGFYMHSIREVDLQQAFRSEQAFMSMYNGIVSSLFSGDNIDEFLITKQMLGLAVDNDTITRIDCDLTQPKEVAKAISNLSKTFSFPSTQFSGYNKVNATAITAGEKACNTFCYPKDQCLILRADAQTEIDYEVLATMFHMEIAKLEAMTILVDNIPSTEFDVYAILCDKESIQMRDTVYRTEIEFLKSNLTWQVMLHHWQYVYLSMFGNCVVFGKTKA
jgi:hypothetical protein